MAIIKRQRKPVEIKVVICPACGRKHRPHVEFGQFCCGSCLQLAIRPLIVAIGAALPKR